MSKRCEHCDKSYKYIGALLKHQKICSPKVQQIIIPVCEVEVSDTDDSLLDYDNIEDVVEVIPEPIEIEEFISAFSGIELVSNHVDIQIKGYTEKSFIVTGDTRCIKEELKKTKYCRWNGSKKGWMISRKRQGDITTLLDTLNKSYEITV